MKYRKKPVVIEAVRYLGHGMVEGGEVPDWKREAFEQGVLQPTNGADPLYVYTREGRMLVSPGDWIIKGIQGELYPCKPDIFAQTYEPVEPT